MNRLVIQTNIAHVRYLWLMDDTGRILRSSHQKVPHHGADRLLVAIDRLLGGRQPDAIIVVRGPGPFTAIRAALVIANTLGYVKKIPVGGLVKKSVLTLDDLRRIGERPVSWSPKPIRPWYGRPPNITRGPTRRYRTAANR